MIELKPNQPRWRQVHAIMRERILTGQYKPGERIPSLITIIEEFGIANATAQKVMRALRADGLIHTEPGMGSFVTNPADREASKPE